MTGSGGLVGGRGEKEWSFLLFYFSLRFLIRLTCGSCPPQKKNYFFVSSALQAGPSSQLLYHFGKNSESVHIANNLQIYRGFLRLKCKVVVFQNFAPKVVVFFKFCTKNRGSMLTTCPREVCADLKS
jgi:hypothetical protein